MTSTTELTEQEQAEADYKVSAGYAAQSAWIDYEALLEVGFDSTQALQLICSWHGRSVVNNNGGH